MTGVASDEARAGHEPSQHAVSAVPVTIANAVERAARRAMADVEVARTGVVTPVNGTRPYSYVTFAGARIEFQQHDIKYHNGSPVYDAATDKASEQADRINEMLMEIAYAAAQNGFDAAQEFAAADEMASLRARVEALETAGRYIKPYLVWTVGDESPGHHPTMPSAVGAFLDTLNAQGIEAQSATTAGRGPQDESPTPLGDASENNHLPHDRKDSKKGVSRG